MRTLKTKWRTSMSANKKEALGKGIRALLQNMDEDIRPDKKSEVADEKYRAVGSVSSIPIDKVEVNPFQPRNEFDADKLQELTDSIKVHGVIQPISVRKIEGGKYQLIAGERRIRAAKMAGLTEVPAYVRTANDQEMLEIALIENIQRENLNAVEIAINYKRLLEECALTQEMLAERVGKKRTTVSNYLRLLKLPPNILKAIKDREISMGHARALINVENVEEQLLIFQEIIKKNLSVRQVEALVRNGLKKLKKEKKEVAELPPAYKYVEDRLSTALSTKVHMKYDNSGKGQIVIKYYSDDDLNRILEIIEEGSDA